MKIAFLTSNLAPYFVSGLRHCVDYHNASVELFHWPTNSRFPYEEKSSPSFSISPKPKDSLFFLESLEAFAPDVIFVAGWRDSDYLKAAKKFRTRGLPVVTGIDNPWKGTARQLIATSFCKRWLAKHFSHAWTPGFSQYHFALRLGFPKERILDGLYSAAIPHPHHTLSISAPGRRILVFVGRLAPEKNIIALCSAFLKANTTAGNSWVLCIAGDGPLRNELPVDSSIRRLGFLQPSDIVDLVYQGNACVLPSLEEPWGVAMHEYAIAGKPILGSKQCGASERLLVDRYNGFVFDARSHSSMEGALANLFSSSSTQLEEMGRRSKALAGFNSSEIWAQRLLSLAQWRGQAKRASACGNENASRT
jgi:glycosyltransferase involved in cell wall biosynthesis